MTATVAAEPTDGSSASMTVARQRIRELFAEITALCRSESDLAPRDFYSEFLTRVVQSLAAIGGAVWTRGPGGLELIFQVNLRGAGLLTAGQQEGLIAHNALIERLIERGAPQIVEPHSSGGDDMDGANPTGWALLVCPLKLHGGAQAAIEAFVRADTPLSTRRSLLDYLRQTCELASEYFKGQELRQFVDRQSLWNQLERFTEVVHQNLGLSDTLYTIAHEGRVLVGCDRLSVAVRHGEHLRVQAISGLDTFDPRSNAVQALNELVTVVAAVNEPLWFTGETAGLEPQVEVAAVAYGAQAHAKAVAVVPLERRHDDDGPRELVGAIVIEQFYGSVFQPGVVQRVEAVTRHAAIALGNALDCSGMFSLPIVKAARLERAVADLPWLRRWLVRIAMVAIPLGALMFVPAPFRLPAQGALEPATEHVFAKVDGEVEEVLVEHGQQVKLGEPLLRLRNDELNAELIAMQGRLGKIREQIESYRRLRTEAERNASDQTEVVAKLQELEIEERYVSDVLTLRQQDAEQLLLKSPRDGEIVTWGVKTRLLRRPVERGQQLLSVGDPQGPWHLELKMAEARVGKLETAWRDAPDGLLVDYVLATDPGHTHRGRLVEIERLAETDPLEGSVVRLRVELDPADLPEHPRPGAGATAKIACGWRPLGYVWLHEIVAFAQRALFRI
jgi:multidrug efflux pump subunit AcrA (membrane-fusion protein)